MDLEQTDYLAGLTDGEGCFEIEAKSLTAFSLRFHITLRADSKQILELLQKTFGGPLIFRRVSAEMAERKPNLQPSYTWQIEARAAVLGLINYFDEHLLVIKAAEYQVWREAAMVYYRHSVGRSGSRERSNPDWLIAAMHAYKSELHRLKEYDAQPANLIVDIDDSQLPLL